MTAIVIMDSYTNGKESEDMSMDNNPPSNFNELKKSCTDCHTTKTPCWRGGPAGPKTLCNACGIRHRKRMRAVLGLEEGRGQRNRRKIGRSSRSKVGVPFKLGLQEEWRKKLGEEEQAAILLMALSYGCVSA